jgi:multidrug efflux pump subunit AcrB
MSRFSVKKPLTIFVAVLLIILLGVISFTKMPTDLLPSMDLPYVAVITTYPGASPEKVETGVTKPLEKTLSTAGGIEKVTSISSENSSMIILQFVQGTNMDSAMIDLSGKLDLIRGRLDDAVGSPTMMKINPDMLPVMIASVDIDEMDAVETSRLVNEVVLPAMERVDGVASVTSMGLVEKQLKITLIQEKIDALNDKILAAVDEKLLETERQLTEGETALQTAKEKLEAERNTQSKKLAQGQTELENGRQQIQLGLSSLASARMSAEEKRALFAQLRASLQAALDSLQSGAESLNELLSQMMEAGILTQEQAQALKQQLAETGTLPRTELQKLLSKIDEGIAAAEAGLRTIDEQKATLEVKMQELNQAGTQLEEGKLTFSQKMAEAERQLAEKEKEVNEGRAKLEEAKTAAYKQAGLGGKITKQTLSSILTAENFSMPAGTLTGEGGEFAVKVGDSFQSISEVENLLLFHLEEGDLGDIVLSDIATVTLTDNSGEMYAKINGNDGILLTFQKQSTASTAAVSDGIRSAMETLESENEGMHLTALNDQGIYIDIVIDSVLSNLLMGGGLAVIILFLFLRKIKPTVIIAVSIPISLLFAVALMYFTGVTLNIISLAGLALGVGMLVDNSIVVIENIYRMRSEGASAAQAAVHGAGQVAGAIAASTLTTVCVFLPIVFTEGISRELFTDMGLTIAYSLVASLIIALTLVPALSSKMLTKPDDTRHKLFDRFKEFYGRLLERSLRRKAVVFILVIVLLGVSVFGATRMGTAFIPETNSNQIGVTLEMPKGSTDEETREMSDRVLDIITAVPGVETIGAMQGGGMMGAGGGSVSMYVLLKEDRADSSGQIAQKITEATADLPCTVTAESSSGDMSAMGGSGLQVDIRGSDLDELRQIAKDIAGIVGGVEGTVDISDGMEETAKELRVTVDKNKAMRYSLTVAQVYQEVAAALSAEQTATTLTINGEDLPAVVASEEGSLPTPDTLRELPLTVTENGEETTIQLGDIAEIKETEGLSSIQHEDQVRTLSVSAAIDSNHNIGLVSRELEAKLAEYEVPEGYSITIAGENETINQTLGDLLTMVLLAIVLIYCIMVAQFQSLLSPFIVMFTIPLAFTGGLLALWIFGFEISVVSMLGFLVLAGIVVNNGIVFVDYVNQLRAGGMEKREALVLAGKTRIRPILMTALTTILGLSTLAFGMGMGADMLQPMAVVTIGGLAYATLLTLFVVPALYDLFQRKPMKLVKLEEESQ